MPPLRRLNSWRSAAVLAGSALLVSGAGLTVLAPSAVAGSVTPQVHCVPPPISGQDPADGPQEMNVTITPSSTTPGSTVHAVVTLGTSPLLSGQTLSQVPTTPSLTLAMSGGATGNRTVNGATTKINITSGQPVQLPTFEGDFQIPADANGTINFTPVSNTTVTNVFGSNYSTTCSVTSGSGTVATVTAQGPGSEQPTLSAPTGIVRPGSAVALSGTGWPASGTTALALCDSTGACNTTQFSANALSISAGGILSGTGTLTATGIPDGNYTVQVSSAGKVASAPVTVKTYVPTAPREVTLDRNRGPVGTKVTVNGKNFNPNGLVRIDEVDANQVPLTTTLNVRANLEGVMPATEYTISNPNTAFIRLREATVPAYAAFTIATDPPTLVVPAGETHRGGVVKVSGNAWTGTPTASLCDAAGNNCSASGISASTASVAGDGTLSGNVTISNSASYGNHVIKLTDPSGQSANSAVVYVNQRWIEISSNPIAPWTMLTVKTHGFSSLLWVGYAGFDANGNQTSDPKSGSWSDINGNASGLLLITSPSTTQIKAWVVLDKNKTAWLPVTMTP